MTAARSERAAVGPVGGQYDPHWVRTTAGRYHRLRHLDVDDDSLAGQAGLVVCWHAGAKPAWVHVGWSENLAAALAALADDEQIGSYEVSGGLFVTWALVRREYCPGMVDHLVRTLHPLIRPGGDGDSEEFPIPVRPPG